MNHINSNVFQRFDSVLNPGRSVYALYIYSHVSMPAPMLLLSHSDTHDFFLHHFHFRLWAINNNIIQRCYTYSYFSCDDGYYYTLPWVFSSRMKGCPMRLVSKTCQMKKAVSEESKYLLINIVRAVNLRTDSGSYLYSLPIPTITLERKWTVIRPERCGCSELVALI